MQIDMHYYATYALARAGGFAKEDSRIIAPANQFVDDNAGTWEDEEILFDDGARLDMEPTAHDTANRRKWTGCVRKHGLVAHQQRQGLVPFHFLLKGEGETYLNRMKGKERQWGTVARYHKSRNHKVQGYNRRNDGS